VLLPSFGSTFAITLPLLSYTLLIRRLPKLGLKAKNRSIVLIGILGLALGTTLSPRQFLRHLSNPYIRKYLRVSTEHNNIKIFI
jgi:hypothetical protein